MKAAKKIMASALALAMAASAGVGALAADDKIEESGGNATVPVTITSAKVQKIDPETNQPMVDENGNPVYEENQYEAPVFSVTLPASLPLTINANGSVNAPTADAFKITNDSAGPVKVTNVQFRSGSTWSFESFSSDFASMQVDSHKLGLSLTADSKTVKTGDTGEALKPNWTIAKDGSLPITAAAAASAVSQTVTEESAASVVFTVGWDKAETPVQTVTFTLDGTAYTVDAGTTWSEWADTASLYTMTGTYDGTWVLDSYYNFVYRVTSRSGRDVYYDIVDGATGDSVIEARVYTINKGNYADVLE